MQNLILFIVSYIHVLYFISALVVFCFMLTALFVAINGLWQILLVVKSEL